MTEASQELTTTHRLCRPDEIPPGGRSFLITHQNQQLNIVVISHSTGFVAYLNRCPHTGVNLEWQPNQFLDIDGNFIQCATHGAKFQISDGFCVFGPCAGESLKAFDITRKNDWLELHLPNQTIIR